MVAEIKLLVESGLNVEPPPIMPALSCTLLGIYFRITGIPILFSAVVEMKDMAAAVWQQRLCGKPQAPEREG